MDTTINNAEAIKSLLEEYFTTIQQATHFLDAMKAAGAIEGLIALGSALGFITEEEADVYIERTEGVASLIQEGIINFPDFSYIPGITPDMPLEGLVERLLKSVIQESEES